MNSVPFNVIKWACDECERQRSGEQSVGWMLRGWELARIFSDELPTEKDIKVLGGIVEPRKNDGKRYRGVGVRVGHSVKMPPREVLDAMERLVAALPVDDPDEWYRAYEEIHPFADGNGRTGSILWNWLRGTLDTPEAPPDFWSDDDAMAPETTRAILARARERAMEL